MKSGLRHAALAVLFLLLAFTVAKKAEAADWPPISPEELTMTSEPLAPGAPAIILYRQVDRDDSGQTAQETDFERIKILKEEGRKYADIEIPFVKGSGSSIGKIKGRTIRADGSISNFEGKPFDKSIVKAKGLKYMAKTFTLPNVEVGCIIEYSYTRDFPEGWLFDSDWILSEELFTKHAKFSLKPYGNMNLRWSWHLLPVGADIQKDSGRDHMVRLEVNNVPAFQVEDYMPPENELKSRVDFVYNNEDAHDPTTFWKTHGKRLNDAVDRFVGKPKVMQPALMQIISPGDSPEVKLLKIYARVQQIRNLTFEREKTEQEQRREKEKDKEKDNGNAEDVWKRGYGTDMQIDWLFLALVRAAGFEAYAVYAADRRNYFFNPALMDDQKLDSELVLIKLNGKDVFCDPGTAFTPFGMLHWPETGVTALRVDHEGGTWIKTMMPESAASRIVRSANLAISETGDLEGKLTVTFTGLEAMSRRLDERDDDDADKRKFLEDGAKEYIPAATDVDLTNKPDWSGSSTPLIAEFKLKIPGWIAGAGRRALLPVGIFTAPEKQVFEHEQRVHPIYFEFPGEKEDDVTISLPPGWQISSLPSPRSDDGHVVLYSLKVENVNGTVHLSRKLNLDLVLLDQKYYPALRNFFQVVRTGDEEQIVLQPGNATARN
jgi:Domain of Unknown Function with PDB structure (DUF3857)